jgi:hypothetical protein
LFQIKEERNMPTGKRSRKGKASVSTVNKEESDSKNRQEKTSVLKQSIPWLEDFEMQCNFILLSDYKETLTYLIYII